MNIENDKIQSILNREEKYLNIHDSYLEIEFIVLDNIVSVFGNDANIRLVNYATEKGYGIYKHLPLCSINA